MICVKSGESDLGFVGFEDDHVTTKTEVLSHLDTILINLTDNFLPLVARARPSNRRWSRLVQRFSERKLRRGKCFHQNVKQETVAKTEGLSTIGKHGTDLKLNLKNERFLFLGHPFLEIYAFFVPI